MGATAGLMSRDHRALDLPGFCRDRGGRKVNAQEGEQAGRSTQVGTPSIGRETRDEKMTWCVGQVPVSTGGRPNRVEQARVRVSR